MNAQLAGGIAAAVLLVGTLTGCSSDDADNNAIQIQDAVVKSASMAPMTDDAADGSGSDADMDMDMDKKDGMEMEPMSAAFMTITNDTGDNVSLTGGSTTTAERIEIHEVVDGVMRPIDGGLVIKDGETSTLEPGGNHVMLMGLTQDLKAGDEVQITLTFSDGSSQEITAPVKDIASGEEPYEPSED